MLGNWVGNALRWKFQAADPIVLRYLNAQERAAVTEWQQDTLPLSFEFHGGHDIGEPIYIRTDGNEDDANVPKLDTKTAKASELGGNLKAIKCWEKLTGGVLKNKPVAAQLSGGDQTTLRVLLQTQMAYFKLIGSRYWNNEQPPADTLPPPPDRPCSATTACLGRVQNTKGKGPCSVCYKYS